jgi:hypothetical protein
MKNTRLASILSSSILAGALMVGSLATTQSALAQSETALAEVTIPFSFQTPTQTLPAGKYRIDRESDHLIRLEGPSNSGGFVVTYDTTKVNAPQHGYLLFDRYGDKYYLRQIWTAGNNAGMECPKSRAEKESQIAQNKQAPSTIELALNSVPQH